MKIITTIILIALVLLAVSSGIAKMTLMQQDVVFFGKYGFSDIALIAFGATQFIAGLLLPFRKTRFAGATILAITLIVSLLLLLLEGNIPVSIATIVATILSVVIMKQSWKTTGHATIS